jgi:predicted RNA-binding Zn-ribbon protein involved in translation (DUF1610 family)
MSIERDHSLMDCPNCKSSCEIGAVKFAIMRKTSTLFVCTSCGFAQVEAPSPPTNWSKVSPHVVMVLGLVMMASAIVYIAMRLLAFEHQPIQTGRLTTPAEQTRGSLNEFGTLHRLCV